MYAGKLVFAQVMEFAPWHTFRRLVAKYRADFNVRTFSCLDQFLSMAFAQITFRESLRDIEACFEAHAAKAYHLGIARQLHAQQFGRCQRALRLAHVLRVRSGVDSYCKEIVCRGTPGPGTGQHGLCAGLHHHRSVSDAVSMGAISLDEGRDQAAYAVGFARRNPQFYPHFRRQMARRQCARHPDPRSRRFLCDGPGVRGFRATLRAASERRVLRHSSQAQLEYPAHRFQANRSQHGTDLRSERDAEQLLRRPGLSGAVAPSPIQGSDNPQIARLLDQPFRYSSAERLRAVQEPLVGRTLFQMDKATSADQTLLRYLGERGQEPSVDRRRNLCAGSDRPKAAEAGFVAAYDAASFERDAF